MSSGKRQDDPIEDQVVHLKEEFSFDILGFNMPVKNAILAGAFTIVTSSTGLIWTASEFMNRLASQEEAVAEAEQTAETIKDGFMALQERYQIAQAANNQQIAKVRQQLDDNDISSLQGKLAKLGANLETIMLRQTELLALSEKVSTLQSEVAERGAKTDAQIDKLQQYNEDMKKIKREIDDLWNGLDALSNPLS